MMHLPTTDFRKSGIWLNESATLPVPLADWQAYAEQTLRRNVSDSGGVMALRQRVLKNVADISPGQTVLRYLKSNFL